MTLILKGFTWSSLNQAEPSMLGQFTVEDVIEYCNAKAKLSNQYEEVYVGEKIHA
jgi:hypothetical protein